MPQKHLFAISVIHHYRNGITHYVFTRFVESDDAPLPSEKQLIKLLEIVFDPDCDEYLDIERLGRIELLPQLLQPREKGVKVVVEEHPHVNTTFCWQNIQTLRPRWSKQRCIDFLVRYSDTIGGCMKRRGWQAIGNLLPANQRPKRNTP